jgi:hypothetical protein
MKKAMLLLAVFGLVAALWAADPFVGTWKLNLAKSKASNPSLLPKSEIQTNAAQGNGIKTTFDGVDVQGKSYHQEGTGNWDGTDFPFTGDPASDMTAIKKIDANTIAVVGKMAGKEVSHWSVAVSKDGKTMTAVGKFKDEKGKEQSVTAVYDRQ